MDITEATIGVVFLAAGVLLTCFIKNGGLDSGGKMRKLPTFPPSPKPPASSCPKSNDEPTVPPHP